MHRVSSVTQTGASARPAKPNRLAKPSQVIQAIRRCHSEGLPLNHVAVLRRDPALHHAILRIFGTWDRAIRAAGLDPEQVRGHRRWSHEAIIRELLQLEAEGKPLNAAFVQRTAKLLAAAAKAWFGSWNAALRAAGIDPARHGKRVPTWTRERVVTTIRTLYARGADVSHAALRRNSVTHAGTLLFGTWDHALRAAGLDPHLVRHRRKPWTPEEILAEIRRKAHSAEPLNAKDVAPYSLRHRAAIFFGSWDAALVAAGLDPAKVRRHWWSRRPRCISSGQATGISSERPA